MVKDITYTLKTIKTQEEVQELYNDSAFTFVGFSTEDSNIKSFLSAMDEHGFLKDKETVVSVISGKVMNRLYLLTGANQYPNDLNIVAVTLSNLKDIQRLALFRLDVGARWFDDVVDNNLRREKVH